MVFSEARRFHSMSAWPSACECYLSLGTAFFHVNHKCAINNIASLPDPQRAEGAEAKALGLAADADAASAQLAQAGARAADLLRQLNENEAALAALHQQVQTLCRDE